MNPKITETSWGSKHTDILSRGCQKCITGEKLVVLVTTECTSNCFYCPLSNERKSSPYSYANERPIAGLNDLLEEATTMDASGASMTGGDPLESHSFSKTLEYCQFLRKTFGTEFHIHIYTRGKELSSESLSKLTPYIDELRFHIINLKKDFAPVILALKFDIDIGVEIPVIPTKGIEYYIDIITHFASILPKSGRNYFINLNELEVAETNYRNMLAHNLNYEYNNESAIEGSSKLGVEIIAWASKNIEIPVHFCALATKDLIQLPNRLYRIAKKVRLLSDVIVPDGSDRGLLIRGVIQSSTNELSYIRHILISKLQIPEELVHLDQEKKRILTNAALLEEMKGEIQMLFPDIILGIVEEYPTHDNLQTTFIPI